jgi:hypothetical protein
MPLWRWRAHANSGAANASRRVRRVSLSATTTSSAVPAALGRFARMPEAYPRWRFFPAFRPPPAWVEPLTAVFAKSRGDIDSLVVHEKPMQSNDVLAVIAGVLEDELGFTVERGKNTLGKLPRPVFFGDQGTYLRTYEIDAFQPEHGIALEVEAGRATMGNAIYRDLIQGALMVDAQFLALAVPVEYRYKSGSRIAREPSYAKTYSVVEAIYGSERLSLPFDGLLLIGY